ncbi:hypothetical protein BRC77_01105 [Halobacteriales archaeon QH_8_64_26]|nr:MAG: hypothetical protein BRC77_01105 [Halobacteriales archaeon QH_8_64_26]
MDLGEKQTAIGALILLVSTILILAIIQFSSLPVLLGSLAAVGMAAGALLIGTDGTGQPV